MKLIANKPVIGVVGLLMGSLFLNYVNVYAEDKPKEIVTADSILSVDITRNDGVSVTPGKDETICTNKQLGFAADMTPEPDKFRYRLYEDEKNKEIDAQIDINIRCQYFFGSDKNYGSEEWKDLDGGTFTLIPGSVADGSYSIRFRKLEEYVLKPEESAPGQISANSVSENSAEAFKKSEHEKNRKAAGKIVAKEPVHAIASPCYRVMLDSTAPTVDISTEYDWDEWTNENIRFRIGINDTCSKPSRLKITCDDARLMDESYPKDTSLSGFERDCVINSETINDEGNELVIEASDTAGNISVIRKKVKIDKTLPVIDIKGAEHGGIYGKPVGIFIAGEDIHPSTVCVGYTVRRKYEGNEEPIVSSAGTLKELREDILFTAEQDGDYYIECHATDAAGNAAPEIKRMFRVDTTAPGLSFDGVSPGAVFRNDVSLKINAFDNFEDSYKVGLSGTLSTSGGTTDLKLAEYRTEGRNSTRTYCFKADGDYCINASVTDICGNSYEESISFSIDKVAPVIDVNGEINLKEAVVTNSPPTIDIKITEANYETADLSCVLKKKDENDRITICKTPEWNMNDEISEFSMTIEEEGDYELNVSAADAAGNTAVKTIKFTLDMTKPEIDYIDNLNRKYVKSFRLPDNFGEYIRDDNGVDYKTYINSMNYDEGSEISEDGKYILKVSAVDDAGNQSEKTVEFIVDSTMPRVVIDGMADDGSVNKDDTLVLSLYDQDDYFRSVRLNGEELVTGTKQKSVEVVIPDYGDHIIEIEASDMADNVLTQTIEAKCADAAPVAKGVSTIRTLKQNEKSGSNKGLRIFLIILTVIILVSSIIVYYLYTVKNTAGEHKGEGNIRIANTMYQ